jgi:prevent-host-death family protein
MVRLEDDVMREVGVLAAKTHLSALIDQVEKGEEVVITRHGRRVARLVPDAGEAHRRRLSGEEIAARFQAFRDHIQATWPEEPQFDWKAAVEEGRE